ncbi:MAG: radical SAM protein [Chloroflexi bacterium]|nr:radical SAM protein [Chloroflexota bacterium]
MGRVVIELTNRCNLSCQHCFTGRHGGNTDLPLELLQRIMDGARSCGFGELSFTGGDPTVHARFSEVLRMVNEAGYKFGFVTNGWNFATIFPRIQDRIANLNVITFSLDGATEKTHDQLRGKGSFRRVLQAMSICVFYGIRFTNNMVVTKHNRHELEEMVALATRLGSQGVRFGHLMPSLITTLQGFDLSPWERKVAEAEIAALRSRYPVPIAIAPGFHTTNLFPCAPLQMQEINVDCHGNVTKCCHLSGHGDGVGDGDVAGNLSEMSFAEAHAMLVRENEEFRERKLRHLQSGKFGDSDFFPCWYCSVYYKKVDWLKKLSGHSWSALIWGPGTEAAPAAPLGEAR